MANKSQKKDGLKEPRINNAITGYSTVRAVYKKENGKSSDEDFAKIMPLWEAKRLAEQMGMDLVEINKNSEPPIVKICDYSKYLFDLKKAEKAKNKTAPKLKEITISPNISEHDMQTKANKAREIIKDGGKVKVSLFFKGREIVRREELKRALYLFIEMVEDVSVPEALPKDEGNRTLVILKPKKK